MEEHYEDDFGLSVGDVMSALLLVFVLLLLAIISLKKNLIQMNGRVKLNQMVQLSLIRQIYCLTPMNLR